MPANNFNFRNKKGTMIPMFVGTTDQVYSSDVGRIVFKPTTINQVSLCCTDSSGLSTSVIAGFIAAVPTNTTRGTTAPAYPIYIYKLDPQLEMEATYTTANGGGHPATSDIGKYIGFYISTTTVTGLQLDMTYCSQDPGTSNSLWFQISGYSTNRRKVYGYPVVASSCFWL